MSNAPITPRANLSPNTSNMGLFRYYYLQKGVDFRDGQDMWKVYFLNEHFLYLKNLDDKCRTFNSCTCIDPKQIRSIFLITNFDIMIFIDTLFITIFNK